MNMTILRYATIASIVAAAAGCDPLTVDPVIDPNNPTVTGVLNNASKGELQNLVAGLEFRHRTTIGGVIPIFGSFGRELWLIQTDPRSLADLLGQGVAPYPDHFGTGVTFQTPYQAIKQANVLIDAVDHTTTVTATEANAYKGFARTIQGLQYLFPLNAQYENGIRIDVKDALNPGPILSYTEALKQIRAILDQGNTDLTNAGTTLPFSLTAGFAGFNTPAGLKQVNRAIAARAAIYAKDWQGALTALSQSFFNLNGDLNLGPKVVYGAPPDVFNPNFFTLNTNAVPLIGVHPSMISDALPNDKRLAKFTKRSATYANPRLAVGVDYQPTGLWPSQTTPIPVIRNEELILIYAEAQAQLNNVTEAVKAIDVIRAAAGLQPYSGATTLSALIDEILFQRRWSLWGEAQRWIDARRYDKLATIPTAQDKGTVFKQMERPASETSWEDSRS